MQTRKEKDAYCPLVDQGGGGRGGGAVGGGVLSGGVVLSITGSDIISPPPRE